MKKKLAITICRPATPDCLYNYTEASHAVYETFVYEIDIPDYAVLNAMDEKQAKGCVINISFVKEGKDEPVGGSDKF